MVYHPSSKYKMTFSAKQQSNILFWLTTKDGNTEKCIKVTNFQYNKAGQT